MKILDEITEAWEKAKADVVRPMECPFDYFGEGYLAAHLSQNVEIQRLRAIIAATRAELAERPAIVAKLEADQDALNDAAYALFQIKRMTPEAIPQFAADAHAKACKHLDNFPAFDKEQQ